MTNFTIHTEETAPDESKLVLERLRGAIGFVPNLYGVLAEAPAAVEAYDVLSGLFGETSLSTVEQHVVLLAINYENNCGYCVPAHTGLAKLDNVPDDVIEALRNGQPIAEPRLQALRTFTTQIVEQRGWVSDDDVRSFLDAGYTRRNILEVIVGLSYKIISNYTNHIAETPVDTAFKKFIWEKPADAKVA